MGEGNIDALYGLYKADIGIVRKLLDSNDSIDNLINSLKIDVYYYKETPPKKTFDFLLKKDEEEDEEDYPVYDVYQRRYIKNFQDLFDVYVIKQKKIEIYDFIQKKFTEKFYQAAVKDDSPVDTQGLCWMSRGLLYRMMIC